MNKSRIKVLISTGNGRLHLIMSAKYLIKHNIDVHILTGWLPRNLDGMLIKVATFLTKHRNLAAGMKKRFMHESRSSMISCPIPEFLTQFLLLFSRKTKLITKDTAVTIGWSFFGWYSSRYINNYDIFHVRAGAGRGGAIKKAIMNNIKVVVDASIAHPSFFDRNVNSELQRNNQDPFITLESKFWKMVLEDCYSADMILVNSEFVKQTFVESGFDKNKIRVVYLGVRKDFYKLKALYEKEKVLNILFTGSFELRKGAEYILKAAQKFDQEGFAYKLTIVGSSSDAEWLLKKYPVKHIDIVGHVPQDQLKSYLSSSDVYLFPSLAEGCASSAMEAMAAGLPVIVTNESGLPVIDGRDGLKIPSMSVHHIVESIYRLDNDIKLRKILGENAANTIAEKYSWDLYAQKVTGIYKEVLKIEE